MKLIFKKAKTKILLVVFLSFLLIYGCGKEEDVIVQPNAKTQNHEFFKHQKTGGDEFKSYILECLAQADDSLSFTGDFVRTYGLPQWDSGMHFGNEEYNSLIIPIYDQENKAISALYYLHYQNQYIKSYILMNDEDDAAYEYSKRLIQYFEKTLNLETSNKEFDLIILENNDSQTKSVKSNIAIDYLICDTYWYKASTTDFTHYWSEEDCFISTEYYFEEHHSSGGWASSNGGNYSTNSPYGGGNSGNSNSNIEEPNTYPSPPVETTQEFKNNKCLSAILFSIQTGKSSFEYIPKFNSFTSSGNFIEKVVTFFDSSTKLTLNYGLNNLGEGRNGTTNGLDITIDETYANTATNLSIARTLIHETIHAYINYKVQELPPNERINSKEFIALDALKDQGITSYSDQQHEYMTSLTHLIGNCLYDWAYNNQINVDREYCYKLSWAGLTNTPTYKKLTKEKKLSNYAITKAINSEATNTGAMKGAKCNN